MNKILKILQVSLFFIPLVVKSQVVYFNPGITYSVLDYRYFFNVFTGEMEVYKDPLISYSVSGGIEFLQQENYSLSGELSLMQAGGKKSDEDNQMIFIQDDKLAMNYLSAGFNMNFLPVNRDFAIQLFLGTRIDLLTSNAENNYSLIYAKENEGIRRINYGITSGTGVYYNIDKLRFGVIGKYLFKFRDSVYVEPFHSDYFARLGAKGKEDIILLQFSIGYNINMAN